MYWALTNLMWSFLKKGKKKQPSNSEKLFTIASKNFPYNVLGNF